LAWLQEATSHVEALEPLLLANYRLMRTQLDALWAYAGHRGKKALCQNG
jgi:hypothetical protein